MSEHAIHRMSDGCDARREVAARLRKLTDGKSPMTECSVGALYTALGLPRSFGTGIGCAAVGYLADLIDPTCEVVGDNPYASDYVFVCKACREHFSVAGTPRYCPGCGRRIDRGNR